MKARWGSFQMLRIVAGAIGCLVVSLAADAAQANTAAAYQLQPLVKVGDQVGGLTIGPSNGGGFGVIGLNNNGQVAFVAGNDAAQSNLLAEYSGGTLVPVALPGQDGPGGKRPGRIGFDYSINMNQSGSVAFEAVNLQKNNASFGIFRWDAGSGQTTPVGLPGTPAADGLTLMDASGSGTAINDSGEVAFARQVKDAAGRVLGQGAFFLGRDGVIKTVALPGQKMPGGGTAQTVYIESLNNAGVVAFATFATPSPDYLWENGTITHIGPNIVGGGVIEGGYNIPHVNNNDATVLVAAQRSGSGPWGLYRWSAGQLTPVLEHGQALPGGGAFKDMDQPSSS